MARMTCERSSAATTTNRAIVRAVLVILSILACTVAHGSDVSQGEAIDVDYCQLVKDPSKFSGKRIRLRAIYVYGFEVSLLEPPNCCNDPLPKMWARIVELDDRSNKLFQKKLNKGMGTALVVFVGKFETGFASPFGEKLRMTVEAIDKVERSTKSNGQSPDPNWIPKCKKPSEPVAH
jgi:hypothetical protein